LEIFNGEASMSTEDEEFNRIEREASLRKAAVREAVSQRQWIGLGDDSEIFAISITMPYANRFEFARAIEAKLKELNT
jgi:hypothetical protein